MELSEVPHPVIKLKKHEKYFITTTVAIAILFFGFNAKSQILLSPDELTTVSQLKDSIDVTTMLSVKGYVAGYGWAIHDEKVNNWYYQSQPGEVADFTFRTIKNNNTKTKTLYWINDPYQYQQFMAAVIREHYQFCGIRVFNKQTCSVFKKKNNSFLISQHLDTMTKAIYYEIDVE